MRLEANNLGVAAGHGEQIFFASARHWSEAAARRSTTISIIPYAVNDAFDGNFAYGRTLVTYDPVLARSLSNAEYRATIGVNPFDNVRLTSNASLAADATINAVLAGGGVTIAGGKTLTVTSGAVVRRWRRRSPAERWTSARRGRCVRDRRPDDLQRRLRVGGADQERLQFADPFGANTYTGGTNLAAGMGSRRIPTGRRRRSAAFRRRIARTGPT